MMLQELLWVPSSIVISWSVNEQWRGVPPYKGAEWLWEESAVCSRGPIGLRRIIFVFSRFRTNLLAANHSIIGDRTRFNVEEKYMKFPLEI
jgi:hypothetical protein